jgi:uncharacterized phage protein gp47/JayE
MTIPLITIDSSGVHVPSEYDTLSGTIDTFKTTLGSRLELDITRPETLSTPQGQLAQAIANITSRIYDLYTFLINQVNPRFASGQFQDGLAWINGITRKTATPTVVVLECRGLDGTQILARNLPSVTGTKAADIYGRTFTCIEGGVISGGVVAVAFECDTLGAVTVPANTVNTIDYTVIGLDSVNNSTAGVTGRNEENQAEMEARRYDSVNALGNSVIGGIYGAVFNVTGVSDLWVDENYYSEPTIRRGVMLSPHSILVCVLGGSDVDIADAIRKSKTAGADMNGDVAVYNDDGNLYLFYRPTPINLYVRVKVTVQQLLPSDTTIQIKQAVYDSAIGIQGQKRVSIGERVLANRFTAFVQQRVPLAEIQDIDVSIDGGLSWHDLAIINGNQIAVVDTSFVQVLYV